MAIVQAVVTRHGGSVDASSVPDRGTRVEVRLPAAGA
jgi:signal transduction histidine kinase